MKYINKPADLKILYKVNIYEKIETIFDLKEGEQPRLHLILALLGLGSKKKIELNSKDRESDKPHEFSLRTVYPKNESDLDAYYGLLSILDNLNLDYDEVINKIAFERTSINDTNFLKMKNVKTFYEYMLAGIDVFNIKFLIDNNGPYDIANNIDAFLNDDQMETENALSELLLEEENLD